jgi:3-hydroxyisobutyrate dehydrogenase-like beta-hydroxyacid dehydrogenase
MKVGFIGLGQMGRAMAARLLDAGHELVVYNRSRPPAEALRERGARVAVEAVSALDAEIVVTMLADDAAVEAVWVAPDLVRRMPAAGVHLNMATVSLRMGRRLADLHGAAGIAYVAAPVFGRPHVAARGELDIVAAGAADAVERCQPLLGVLGKQSFVVGTEPHQANIVKIARNFLLGTVVESLGEAFALVRKAGADPARFLDIITRTSFAAPAYRNYGRMMLEAEPEATFLLKLGLKDVELAYGAGAELEVPLPTARLLREQHLAAINAGFGERDWATLGHYIAEKAGLEPVAR